MTSLLRRTALATLAGALALGTAGCGGGEDAEKAATDAAAQREAQYEAQLMEEGVAHNVQCLSAIRWQEDALQSADIGDLDIYRSYFRENIENKLGDTVIPADPPQPELSVANLDPYLDWAYARDVEETLAGGGDTDGDGEVTDQERSARGFQTVGSCIQEVAEMGEGPLAGPDKTDRMFRIERMRNSLEAKGA